MKSLCDGKATSYVAYARLINNSTLHFLQEILFHALFVNQYFIEKLICIEYLKLFTCN